MLAAIILAAALDGGACTFTGSPVIELTDDRVRIADLLEPGCPSLAGGGNHVVAALPVTTLRIELTRAALASLVRRRLPDIQLQDLNDADAVVALRRGDRSATVSTPCFELARPVARGDALVQSLLAPAACDSDRPRIAVRYDRRHAIARAGDDADAGAFVGQLAPQPAEIVEAEQAVTLQVTAGPVVISRAVRTVQPAHQGQALFVRDADGRVFAAPSQSAEGGRP